MSEERDYESEARKEGWVSQDEWVDQGKDPDAWRPADEFVKRGEEISGYKIKKLERELNDTRKRLDSMSKESERALKLQQDAYEKELKSARAQAIASGDGEKVNELDDQLDELREQRRAAKEAPKEPVDDTAVREFYEKNGSWYGKDSDLTELADGFGWAFKAQHPNAAPEEILEHIERKMKPHVKGKMEKKPTVEGATRGTSKRTKEKTYDNLPSEAKQMCDQMLARIPAGQRDAFKQKYVEGFSWD